MKAQHHVGYLIASAILLVFGSGISSFAQDGKLVLHVSPRQAYIFVDGKAISEASKHHSLNLSAGDHKIELVNYGYTPETRNVTITAGKSTNLDVTLNAVTGTVSGPFGAMTIEHADRDAVLLNGKSPEFFVGHGDEFNNDWLWKQELVVPPGTYQVSVLHEDKEVWSGSVNVPSDKRVVIDIPKGVRKTVDWPRGQKLSAVPRFTVGTASATVAVAKPTAELTVASAQVNCGDSTQLKWSSTDAPKVEITPNGGVAASGQQSVDPKQTTTYQLTAEGPGGTATSSATVNLNNAVQANLQLSPAEVHYKRVGDKVVEQGSAALNWNAGNATTVSIDPLGTVATSGNQNLQITPKKTDPGPVDETVTYTLNASNGCGGTDTKTATLHIVGDIEQPQVELSMRSVFFPTDRPRSVKSEAALLPSEQETLTSIATAFKQYLAVQPDAKLILAGHADRRGPQAYNKPLSERRAELAKMFLVQQGVPDANIETQAFGKEKNLTAAQVKELLGQNSDISDQEQKTLQARFATIVYAYNRRVDVNVTPAGKESTVTYPVKSADFARLIDRNGPTKEGSVQMASKKEKVSSKQQ